MVEERRRPGRRSKRTTERRDTTPTPGVAPRLKLG
jgi:hypothetical protein